ncbi:hypothetical protein AWENTII_012777 [Aspergillus wentii]
MASEWRECAFIGAWGAFLFTVYLARPSFHKFSRSSSKESGSNVLARLDLCPNSPKESLLNYAPGILSENEIMQALQSLDLSATVSLSDSSEGGEFVVESELDLTSRVDQNICDPVSKQISNILNIRFGDNLVMTPATTLIRMLP